MISSDMADETAEVDMIRRWSISTEKLAGGRRATKILKNVNIHRLTGNNLNNHNWCISKLPATSMVLSREKCETSLEPWFAAGHGRKYSVNTIPVLNACARSNRCYSLLVDTVDTSKISARIAFHVPREPVRVPLPSVQSTHSRYRVLRSKNNSPSTMNTANRFMHPRNMYRTPPNFKELAAEYPEFKKYSVTGLNGKVTFDFKNQDALRMLATILLKKDFNLDIELPVGKLVPTVPLRLNYLLWIEDLFNLNYDSTKKIKGIDIGTGASCIYPLLAAKKFNWSMVGTDINKDSIKNAIENVEKNNLQDLIQVIEVSEWDSLLPVADNEHYDFCMCNPPFHKSSNLNSDDDSHSGIGDTCEMYTVGGEVEFIQKIMRESETLRNSISIYTSMVGYKSSLGPLKNELKSIGASAVAEAGFFQGQTARWGIAWTFQPDIKLKDFMPNKELQKVKLKPPVSFNISESYDSTTALAKLTELLSDLKMSISLLKSEKDENILYQADIKAYENTWTHQRRKRRMEQKSTDNKRQKTDENSHNESYDERVEQDLKTAANAKALFAATLVLRKTDDTIWIDMLHLDGNRDNSYQLFQFFKNRFV